jgi:hypothetical protein
VAGKRVTETPCLDDIRKYAGEQLKSLPQHLRKLHKAPLYPVEISTPLARLREETEKSLDTTA